MNRVDDVACIRDLTSTMEPMLSFPQSLLFPPHLSLLCVHTFGALFFAARQLKTPRERQPPINEKQAEWHLPPNIGWQYALCSGDFNPIHLHSLTAKAFGQRTCIAHGMYTLARAVAGVNALAAAAEEGGDEGKTLAYPIQVANEWKLPLRIPSKVRQGGSQQAGKIGRGKELGGGAKRGVGDEEQKRRALVALACVGVLLREGAGPQ